MHARRALLKKLASAADWDSARGPSLQGESWIETRNTMYRFRDGICVGVASRDPRRSGRVKPIAGMRIVAFLVQDGPRLRLSYAWQLGACAVLWRPDVQGGDEAMAMTSPTTAFTIGASPACLQALHDAAPPDDSSTFQRAAGPRGVDRPRPKLPSQSSQSGY